ncbi:MAG: TRAP transporter small permease [Peptococcaceae bacterium]
MDYQTKILKGLLAFIFIFDLIIGTAQVLSRYLLPFNIAWTHEITRYGFVWMSMLGAALAAGEKGHIAMEFFKARFKGTSKLALELLIYLINLLIFLIIFYFGAILTLRNVIQLSPTMQISMAIPYSAVPFGTLCMLIYTFRHIMEALAKMREGKVIGSPKEVEDLG